MNWLMPRKVSHDGAVRTVLKLGLQDQDKVEEAQKLTADLKRLLSTRRWRARNPGFDSNAAHKRNPARKKKLDADWAAKNRDKVVQKSRRYYLRNAEAKRKKARDKYWARKEALEAIEKIKEPCRIT